MVVRSCSSFVLVLGFPNSRTRDEDDGRYPRANRHSSIELVCRLDIVTPCSYIVCMKKSRRSANAVPYPVAGGGAVISVREAKAHFSALVDRAAGGEEITITWHGQPRARLAAVRSDSVPFRVDRAWLRSVKVRKGGPSAEALIREDRDARG